MFQIEVTRKFKKNYNKLTPARQQTAKNKTKLFKQNPRHSSLNCEKMEPKKYGIWSFRVDKKYRIIFQFKSRKTVIFWDINNHYN